MKMPSSLGRDGRGTGLDHGEGEFSPIGPRDHGGNLWRYRVWLSAFPYGVKAFRPASGRVQASEQNETFSRSNVPFCPILSHSFLLIWSVRSVAKLSFDMAGDVEPRILRISRMREENMTRYPDRDSTEITDRATAWSF